MQRLHQVITFTLWHNQPLPRILKCEAIVCWVIFRELMWAVIWNITMQKQCVLFRELVSSMEELSILFMFAKAPISFKAMHFFFFLPIVRTVG